MHLEGRKNDGEYSFLCSYQLRCKCTSKIGKILQNSSFSEGGQFSPILAKLRDLFDTMLPNGDYSLVLKGIDQ